MANDQQEFGYSITYRDAVRILELVQESSHCTSFDLQFGDLKLVVSRAVDGETGHSPIAVDRPAPAVLPVPDTNAPKLVQTGPAKDTAVAADGVAVRAPMLGTFYRAPAPTEPPFVVVGQTVNAADTIGLIEVMKLFTPVTAGVAGVVTAITVESGEMVEYDQSILYVRPV